MLDKPCGPLAIQGEIPFVPERDGQISGNLARIDGAGKGLLLRLRTQQDWRLLDEDFVIFGEFEAVLLKGLAEVIQLWVVTVTSSAGSLILA